MSQNDLILAHLKRYRKLTPMQAYLLYGALRLGARIYNLRARGHRILTRIVTVRNRRGQDCRVAQYTLAR